LRSCAGLGYLGGYDAVRRYARQWQRAHSALTAEAYVPLSFAPGEAYQFNWSHEILVRKGAAVTVKAAALPQPHDLRPRLSWQPGRRKRLQCETQEIVFERACRQVTQPA
jgi:hypothetical protein